MTDLVRVALHEAGHCVAALACGHAVLDVELRPFEQPDGFANLVGPLGASAPVIMLAGEVAAALTAELPAPDAPDSEPAWLYRARVRRAIDPPPAWWQQPSSRSDEHEVERARALANEPGAPGERAALEETYQVLRAHWPAVTAIASELLERGRLEGDQVRAIWTRMCRKAAA